MSSNTMTYNSQQYETVYGFSMLDELHNFMPEVLYDATMFPNEMVAYFRHRMSLLFHPTFVRQQHLYNIYMATDRRTAFTEWRRSHTAAPVATPVPPAGVPDILAALNNAFSGGISTTANIRVEVPVNPETPPAQIRRRVTTTVGAPGAEPPPTTTTNINTPPPPRRTRNSTAFMSANELYHLVPPEESLINILTGALTGGITNGMGGGARGFWREVDVTATDAQIAAGSTVIEEAAIAADVNCAICQEHTYADDMSSHQWRQLHCAHQFHRECVDSWLEQSVHCPVCRADIREHSGGASAAPAATGSYAAAARRGVSRSPSTS